MSGDDRAAVFPQAARVPAICNDPSAGTCQTTCPLICNLLKRAGIGSVERPGADSLGWAPCSLQGRVAAQEPRHPRTLDWLADPTQYSNKLAMGLKQMLFTPQPAGRAAGSSRTGRP